MIQAVNPMGPPGGYGGADNPDRDLYDLHVQYQRHKLDAMLRVADNAAMEKTHREVYAAESFSAFCARLGGMSERERADFEKRLRDGFERTHAAEAPSEADSGLADPVPDDVRAWLLRRRDDGAGRGR